MAARRAVKDPTEEEYVPSEAEKEADAAALRQLGKTGVMEVSLDDDDDDDEDGDLGEPRQPNQPSRQQKRRERKTLLDQLEQEREARGKAESAASQALGYAQGLAQQVQRAPGPTEDPLEAERKALQAEQDLLVREFELKKDKLTSADAQEFKERAWRFEEKKAAYLQKKTAPPQQNPTQDPTLLLSARYPDVMSNERARAWAFNRYNQRMIETNRNDWELRDSVVEEAREMFNMKPRRQDDREPAMRRKLAGTSKGGNGGGGGDRGNSIQLTPQQVKEADIAFPNDPNRYRRFARHLVKDR